jgi:hypothetical protein
MGKRIVPPKYRQMYDRAMKGKSRKAAMQALCAECVGWVSTEIKFCTDKGCPLYPYRQLSDEINPVA